MAKEQRQQGAGGVSAGLGPQEPMLLPRSAYTGHMLYAMLMVLAVEAFVMQLWLSNPGEDDTRQHHAGRQDGELGPSGFDDFPPTTRLAWAAVITKLKIIIRLTAYIMTLMATWRRSVAQEIIPRSAKELTAWEANSGAGMEQIQGGGARLERTTMESTSMFECAEQKCSAHQMVLEGTQAALAASREETAAAKVAAVAARADVLIEKEKAADLHAAIESVVRKKKEKMKFVKKKEKRVSAGLVNNKEKLVFAADIQDLQEKLAKLEVKLTGEARRADAAEKAILKKSAELEAVAARQRGAGELASGTPTSSDWLAAIEVGNVRALRRAKESGCVFDDMNESACSVAAEYGQVQVLRWLRSVGCPWNELAFYDVAYNGHLEVVQWLRTNHCPWNEGACSAAAESGHLDVLQWLVENGCPWNELDCCANAAFGGHVEVLQWLRGKNCPWNEWACSYAAQNGHLEVL